MKDSSGDNQTGHHAPQPGGWWGIRLVGYAKRKKQERLAKREAENPTDRSARSTATATWWIAAFTVVLAAVGVLTLTEIIQGGHDTTALVDAAKKSAGAAQKSAEAAQGFAKSAGEIDRKIGQAESDFSRMAGNSADAIEATQTAMRLDQRAWVGLLQVTGTPEIGKPYEIESILDNTGRTPAKNLIRLQTYSIVPRGAAFIPTYDASKADLPSPSVSILFPNQFYRGTTKISNSKNIEQIDIDRVTRGDVTVYVYGKVCYKDVFNKPHWERFCDFYSPATKSYSSCAEYNEIDSEKNGGAESCDLHSLVSKPN